MQEAMIICLRGARDICGAVGENPKEIVRLVEREGFPAWRRDGRGAWRALPEDLREWVSHQRDRNLGRYQRAVYGVAAEQEKAGQEKSNGIPGNNGSSP